MVFKADVLECVDNIKSNLPIRNDAGIDKLYNYLNNTINTLRIDKKNDCSSVYLHNTRNKTNTVFLFKSYKDMKLYSGSRENNLLKLFFITGSFGIRALNDAVVPYIRPLLIKKNPHLTDVSIEKKQLEHDVIIKNENEKTAIEYRLRISLDFKCDENLDKMIFSLEDNIILMTNFK